MKPVFQTAFLDLCFILLNSFGRVQSIGPSHQTPLFPERSSVTSETRRVGVLGGGPAGISAVKHIHTWALEENITVEATVLTLGHGRCSSDLPYRTNPHLWAHWVESGSYGINNGDRILNQWIEELNLDTVPSFSSEYGDENWYLGSKSQFIKGNGSLTHLGVWDGQRFVVNLTSAYNHWEPWWKHLPGLGESIHLLEKLVQDARHNFSRLYDPPVFPFAHLTEAIRQIGLEEVLSTSANDYLKSRDIEQSVIETVLQALARRSHGTDITSFGTALPALMSLTKDMPQVPLQEGGLFAFYHELCVKSEVTECLTEHKVTLVKRSVNSDEVCTHSIDSFAQHHWHCFDDLIIAAPFVESNIVFEPPLPNGGPPDTIKTYNQIWTSFVATPHTLNPEFFNAQADTPLPDEILTTCFDQECEFHNSNLLSVVRLGIVQRPLEDYVRSLVPEAGPLQNLYQLSTKRRPDLYFLMHLFSGPNSTFPLQSTLGKAPTAGKGYLFDDCNLRQPPMHISPDDISWFCSRGWTRGSPRNQKLSSYEKLPPIRFAKNIWYTSGMENIDSSMEAAALMGANVARLVVDEWVKKAK